MEKVIKIGKQEVRLNNNVAWTMEYRDQFGKDIIPALMPTVASMLEGVSTILAETGGKMTTVSIAEALQGRVLEVLMPMYQIEFVDFINITWAMAKAADEDILPPKQWVKQFETFPVDVVAPAVFDLILKGSASSKNLRRLKNLGESLKALQPSHSTISSSQDSSEG